MMLRVEWDGRWEKNVFVYKKCGTVVGYVHAHDTRAIVLRDGERALEEVKITQCHPIGWRREYQIT